MSGTGTKRYNCPPNWPAPPADWSPPAGWSPDPSWPPAPAGWQFWVEDEPAVPPPASPGSFSQLPKPAQVIARVAPAVRAMRGYARAAANVAGVMVNPPRVLYAAAAAAGAVLFLRMFILVRFTSEWALGGWMWRGVWPVLAMCVGLAVAISGALRARWWSYTRWSGRRPRTPEPTPSG